MPRIIQRLNRRIPIHVAVLVVVDFLRVSFLLAVVDVDVFDDIVFVVNDIILVIVTVVVSFLMSSVYYQIHRFYSSHSSRQINESRLASIQLLFSNSPT